MVIPYCLFYSCLESSPDVICAEEERGGDEGEDDDGDEENEEVEGGGSKRRVRIAYIAMRGEMRYFGGLDLHAASALVASLISCSSGKYSAWLATRCRDRVGRTRHGDGR